MAIYRQGDVLLRSIPAAQFPSGEMSKSREITLALGEATGHSHVLLADPTCPEIEFIERDGTMYLKVAEPSPLVHEEHARITVEPGIYKVQIGREYSPEAIRNVMD